MQSVVANTTTIGRCFEEVSAFQEPASNVSVGIAAKHPFEKTDAKTTTLVTIQRIHRSEIALKLNSNPYQLNSATPIRHYFVSKSGVCPKSEPLSPRITS
jgi:hypothetical protein